MKAVVGEEALTSEGQCHHLIPFFYALFFMHIERACFELSVEETVKL